MLGEQHDKLWDMTEGILKEVVGDEEAFKSTADKMASFRAGYGTVLFFEDNNVIAGRNKTLPLMPTTSRYGPTNPTACRNL